MIEELKVISDFYDFTLWLVQRVEKFPRHHRYSLGTAIENRLQTILALLLRAKYRSEKASFLDEANIELEILRYQIRMAKDLKLRSVQGPTERGEESPGLGPAPLLDVRRGDRINAVPPDGVSRLLGSNIPSGWVYLVG
jgi:hypothetical protein